MAEFYSIMTDIGRAKEINGHITGTPVQLTQFAIGDGLAGGYYNPTSNQLALKNEVWRGAINRIAIHDTNPSWLVVETLVPAEAGPFSVREAGLFDVAGDMIAVGKYPETYKPALSSGAGKDLYIRMILEIGDSANVVLKIDPAVVLASRAYVDDAMTEAGFGNPVTLAVETTLDRSHGTVYLNPPEGATVRYHLPIYESVTLRKRYRLKNIGQGLAEFDAIDAKTIDELAVIPLAPGDHCNISKDAINWQTN